MKYIVCSLLLLFGIICGCAMSDRVDSNLRLGLAAADVNDYRTANKYAQNILKNNRWDHAAQLLKVRAVAQSGDIKTAITEAVRYDRTCRADQCTNESAHINLLLFLSSITNEEETLKKAQEKIAALQRKMAVQQHSSLVDFYTKQGCPHEAAAAFDKLMEASEGNLNAEQKLAGWVLYNSVFETEKADLLYKQLNPQQKVMIKNVYGDIQSQ